MERPAFFGFHHAMAKGFNIANQQVVGVPFQQIYGVNSRPARYAVTTIVQHEKAFGIDSMKTINTHGRNSGPRRVLRQM